MLAIRSAFVAALLLGAAGVAQATSHASRPKAGIPAAIRHYEKVELGSRAGDAASRRLAAGGPAPLAFRALGRRFDLELEMVDVFSPGARVVWVDAAGEVEEAAASSGTFVRGRVAGEADSWVRLRLDGGELAGIVATADEIYFLEPARRFLGAKGAGQTIAYRLSDTDALPLGSCAAHAPERPSFSRSGGSAPRGGSKAARALLGRADVGGLAAVANKRAELGIVADFQYFSAHGASSASDIAAIINAVDGIYQAELGVAMHIRNLVIYQTSNDPFSETTNYNSLLNEFSAFHDANDNTPSQVLYGSDLAHLITGRDLDGNVIGVAWLGALCDGYYGSGLSQDFSSSLLMMTLLVAHEMGHNYGAPHDAQSGSACSGAPNTFIMNPVLHGGLQQQFSACSKAEVANDIAAASCFDAYTPGPTATPTNTFTPTRTPTLTPTRTGTPTRTPTPAPIGVPNITQPGANQQLATGGVTFAWSAVANAVGYELQILTGQGQTVFSGSLVGGGSTSTLIVLPSNGSYVFRVRACVSSGCGNYATRNFSISLTTPSSAPSIIFPAAGAHLTSSIHNLVWTAVTAGGDLPVLYEVELIDLIEGDTELRITVPDPVLNTVARLHSGTYRVRARACQAGCGPWSAAHDFTAGVPAQPSSAPSLASPTLNGSALTVAWSTVAGAEWYQVYVIQPPPAGPGGGALTVAAREVVGTTTVLSVPLGAASVIVSACTGNGCGPFSSARSITSTAPNPNVPNLGTPLGGAVVQGPTVLFTWNRIPSDNGSNTVYRLYVQDLSRGMAAFDVYTTDNFYGGYFKAEGARYDALVVANPGPSQVIGPATGFIVAGQSSAAPTMTQPAHNSTVGQGNVQLGWSPVPGATLYEYFVAIPGSSTPPTRGVTPGTLVQVPLSAAGGAPTLHSAIVRACPAGATCAAGSESGWGPWSNAAGPGVTNFTVVQ